VSRNFEIGLTVDMTIDLLMAWFLPAMGKRSLLAIIGASGKPEGTVQVDLSFMIGPLHPVTKAIGSPSFGKFCS
jgi:hypothetical protein